MSKGKVVLGDCVGDALKDGIVESALLCQSSDEVGALRVAFAVCIVSGCATNVVLLIERNIPFVKLLDDVLLAIGSSKMSYSATLYGCAVHRTLVAVEEAEGGQVAACGSIVGRCEAIAVCL